jgi:hypothetical protein
MNKGIGLRERMHAEGGNVIVFDVRHAMVYLRPMVINSSSDWTKAKQMVVSSCT